MDKVLEYLPFVLSGTYTTILVSLLSLFISVILGFLGAFGKIWGGVFVRYLCNFYTTVVRGVPDLVLILLLFYGAQIGINEITEAFGMDYIEISPLAAGVATIGFIYGAYMAETFRGAIMAIDNGQIEAGYAFGMSNLKIFFRITFPLMVRHAVASFINNWLVLIKSTALISIIGLEDIVRKSSMAGGITKQPFSFLFIASLVYILITSVSILIIKVVEKKFEVIG